MTHAELPLDVKCARCEAPTTILELELPDGIEQPSEPMTARIGVTMRCESCGNSVIFGEIPAKVVDGG